MVTVREDKKRDSFKEYVVWSIDISGIPDMPSLYFQHIHRFNKKTMVEAHSRFQVRTRTAHRKTLTILTDHFFKDLMFELSRQKKVSGFGPRIKGFDKVKDRIGDNIRRIKNLIFNTFYRPIEEWL